MLAAPVHVDGPPLILHARVEFLVYRHFIGVVRVSGIRSGSLQIGLARLFRHDFRFFRSKLLIHFETGNHLEMRLADPIFKVFQFIFNLEIPGLILILIRN